MSCYLGGLDEEIQLAKRMFFPKSVQQALCLAKLQEATQNAKRNKTGAKSSVLPTPPTKQIAATPFRSNTQKYPVNTPNPNRKTLTPEEFNEKRAKNICFWCDERYVPCHKYKGKKPQLYHIEMEDDVEEDS